MQLLGRVSVLLLLSLTPTAVQAGFYRDSSPVLEISAVSYPKLIAESNYTSIVEFYAPWCGHCKSLKPAYEKAAASLAGLAQVAAIDCDDDLNKPLCGQMGIKGFPTLKIVKPGSRPGKPRVKDYNGERTAKAIVDAVIEEIPDHTTRLFGEKIQPWIGAEGPKVVLFTDKHQKSPLFKSLAIEFLAKVSFGLIRESEIEPVKKYGIKKYPTLLYFSGVVDDEPIAFDGKLKKGDLVKWIEERVAGLPTDSIKEPAEPVVIQEPMERVTSDAPFTSPGPIVTPAPMARDLPLPVPIDSSEKELRSLCLAPTSPTCIFILLAPSEEQAYSQETPSDSAPPPQASPPAEVQSVLKSMANIKQSYLKSSRSFFPVFAIDVNQQLNLQLRQAFGMTNEMQLVAIKGKGGWWNQYGGTSADRQDAKEPLKYGEGAISAWIDDLKLGNAKKEKITEGLIGEPSGDPVPTDGKPAEEVEKARSDEAESQEQHDEL